MPEWQTGIHYGGEFNRVLLTISYFERGLEVVGTI